MQGLIECFERSSVVRAAVQAAQGAPDLAMQLLQPVGARGVSAATRRRLRSVSLQLPSEVKADVTTKSSTV